MTQSARRLLRTAFAIPLLAALMWGGGLILFVNGLPRAEAKSPSTSTVDGIVVLTGGQGRIGAGLRALERGHGRRLLISGVNADIGNATILRAIGTSSDLARCCVDLGRAAQDTRGNAKEALDWSRRHNFNSLLIVTADYHMPRTLLEFQRVMPDTRFEAEAVETSVGLGAITLEYSKYLVSLLFAGTL